jgi:ubiquitin-like protein ATG12
MAASVVLTHLPRDASKALENAGNPAVQKSRSHSTHILLLPISHPCPQSPNYTHLSISLFPPTHTTYKSFLTSPLVTVRLQPLGSAPHLTQRVFKVSTKQSFASIVRFLRKRLGVKEHESVFCYVGSVFAPALDEGVGNLWNCFKQGDELVVGYAMSPAFG